ncbi:MAG: hypothetical protein AB9Q20_06850 [Candidatus Reddybacter sp.]
MINYYKLGFTLFLALVLSSLVVLVGFKLWASYELRLLSEKLEVSAAVLAQESKLQADKYQKELADKSLVSAQKAKKEQELRRKREHQVAVQRGRDSAISLQKKRTCEFWKAEFRKTKNFYDKSMRDAACK